MSKPLQAFALMQQSLREADERLSSVTSAVGRIDGKMKGLSHRVAQQLEAGTSSLRQELHDLLGEMDNGILSVHNDVSTALAALEQLRGDVATLQVAQAAEVSYRTTLEARLDKRIAGVEESRAGHAEQASLHKALESSKSHIAALETRMSGLEAGLAAGAKREAAWEKRLTARLEESVEAQAAAVQQAAAQQAVTRRDSCESEYLALASRMDSLEVRSRHKGHEAALQDLHVAHAYRFRLMLALPHTLFTRTLLTRKGRTRAERGLLRRGKRRGRGGRNALKSQVSCLQGSRRHDLAQLRGELRDASAQLQHLAASAREAHARAEERIQGAIDRSTVLERKVEQVSVRRP